MTPPVRVMRAPDCDAFGCIGTGWCDYCGKTVPVRRDARERLATAIEVLRDSLHRLREAA